MLYPHLRSPAFDESVHQYPCHPITWCSLSYRRAPSLALARAYQQQEAAAIPPPSPSSFLQPYHKSMEEGEPEAQRAGLKAARALMVLGLITARECKHLLSALSFTKTPPSPPPLHSSQPPAVPTSPYHSSGKTVSPPPPPPPRRLDPISLEPLCEVEGGTHTFCFPPLGGGVGREGGKEEGCEVVYNVRSLCEYLVATGQFVEPTSRRAIEGEDVQVRMEGGGKGGKKGGWLGRRAHVLERRY